VRISASDFAAEDLRAVSGFVANAGVTSFAVTQFTKDEDAASVLKRIGAIGTDEVLVYRTREKRA
jgi:hypothetical protein